MQFFRAKEINKTIMTYHKADRMLSRNRNVAVLSTLLNVYLKLET